MRKTGPGALRLALAGLAVAGFAVPAGALDQLRFEVAGGADGLEDDLRGASLLVESEGDGTDDPQELLAAARADYARLLGVLYSNAHYGGVINILVDGTEAAQIPPLNQLAQVGTVVVQVRPGPIYRFSQADVTPLAPGTELPEGYAVGEPARSTIIRDAAGQAVSSWRDVGFAKADIGGQNVIAQHERDSLAASIAISTGPRVTFGDLAFEGGGSVRPARLRAIAGFPDGEIYSPEELDNVARRLRQTGVFSSVALVEDEELSRGDQLDVTAKLIEQKPRRIGFGAEVSTVEGASLTAYWMHRNLLGGAERLRFDGAVTGLGGQTGGLDYSLKARFERPATFAPENNLYVEAAIAHLEEPDFTADTVGFGAGIERRINERASVSYGLAYRFSDVEDDSGQTQYSLLSLPLSGTYDSREEPLNATQGFYVKLDAAPFAGLNGSTGTGARLTFDTRTYLGLGTTDRLVLAGRVSGGSILGPDLTEVPNDFRFYIGGGGTVRGQEYQSLGVLLEDDVESGGGSFVALSAEARGRVTDNIGLVAFADFGIVGRDSFPGGDSDNHAGAGLGLRYLTPIGPIRLDVAAPIGGDSQGIQVYVGIGQSF